MSRLISFLANAVNWAAVSEEVGRAPKVSLVHFPTESVSHWLTHCWIEISLAVMGMPSQPGIELCLRN